MVNILPQISIYSSEWEKLLKWLIGPLIFLVAWLGKKAYDVFFEEDKVDIAILGPNQAGKTTLWNYLKGKPSSTVYKETEGSVRLSFKSSNKSWNVSKIKGYDINGNGDFIRDEWEKIVKESNMIIFIFNASEYLSNIEYQRDVNQRMQFVKSVFDGRTDKAKRDIWLLGSYADLLSNRSSEWRKVIDLIRTKPYRAICNNSACLNLMDKKALDEYFNKMFKK